jgi:hypothetical protein
MFRKFVAVVAALMLVGGGLFADEIKGVFKKFEDGKLTFLDADGKEKTYKVDPDAKFKRKGKDGTETEVELTKMLSGKFMTDGKKITVTVEKDIVTKVVPEFGKKKKDPNTN